MKLTAFILIIATNGAEKPRVDVTTFQEQALCYEAATAAEILNGANAFVSCLPVILERTE